MSSQTRSLAVAGAISLAAHAAVSLAQSDHSTDRKMITQAPTERKPMQPGADLATTLRGPEVAATTTRPTLIKRTFAGELERLHVQPAEAALDLIQIDDGARQRVIAILDKRAAAMDKVALDNLDLLTQIESAAETGRMFRVLQIVSQIHRDFEREAGRASLVDQCAGVLPADKAQDLRRLVDEYWDALARDEAGDDVGRIEAFVIKRRAALEVFGKDVERAIERISMDDDDKSEQWERMLASLELTPDQDRTIRDIGHRFYIESRLNPSTQERADFLTSIYLKLDGAQRTKFFQMIVSSE